MYFDKTGKALTVDTVNFVAPASNKINGIFIIPNDESPYTSVAVKMKMESGTDFVKTGTYADGTGFLLPPYTWHTLGNATEITVTGGRAWVSLTGNLDYL